MDIYHIFGWCDIYDVCHSVYSKYIWRNRINPRDIPWANLGQPMCALNKHHYDIRYLRGVSIGSLG